HIVVARLRAVVNKGVMIEWSIAACRVRYEHKTAARICLQNIPGQDRTLTERTLEAISFLVLICDLKQLPPAWISQNAIGIVVVSGIVRNFVPERRCIGRGDFRQPMQSLPPAYEVDIRV